MIRETEISFCNTGIAIELCVMSSKYYSAPIALEVFSLRGRPQEPLYKGFLGSYYGVTR